MKKLLLLVSFIFIASLCFGQVLPTNWTGDSDIDTYKEETIIHEGTYSCKVVVNSGTQGNCDFSNDVEITVTGDDTYTVSFWAYTSEHVRITCVLDWNGASSTYTGVYVGPNTGGWAEFTYSNDVPTSATGVNLRLRFYDTSGFSAPETCYVDDVTFQSPTGTPIAVTNGDFETWPAGNDISYAYAISDDELEVYYVGDVSSVNPADYELTGSATIIFSTATIDGANAKLVHLSGASTAMADDNTLDTISDEAKSTYDFYAGITSISYTNTLNPAGKIDDTHTATFQGIVSANDEYNNVWVSDAAGTYNGALIYDYTFDTLVDVGDEILFTADRTTYNGLTELEHPELISTISTGNAPYGPTILDAAEINENITVDTNPGEMWEGQLVKIENFYVESSGDYYYRCTADAGSTYFYVGDNVDYHFGNFELIVGLTYQEIIGVVDWYNSGPYYRINPRDNDDQTLPIELAAFTAEFATNETGQRYVSINWATASETDVIGFNIYRNTIDNFENSDKINIDPIEGQGTTTIMHPYSYSDYEADIYNSYYYWLEVINYGGINDIHGSIEYKSPDVNNNGELDIINSILNECYPNPAISGNSIKFSFTVGGLEGTYRNVELKIFNILGEIVDVVIDGNKIVNKYPDIEWTHKNLPNGIYFYQLKTDNFNEVRKFVIIE